MSHPFGDLVSQHLHRKHGLSQSKLAAGIHQPPAVITAMCKGQRLTGPKARERVLAIIGWLHQQGALNALVEADAMLNAAGMVSMNGGSHGDVALLTTLTKEAQSQFATPGARVSTAAANNIPSQPTPFVGRKRELSAILNRLEDPACRLLTLIGPGGVGKSRLSIEAARQVAVAVFSDGAYFVQLAPVDAPNAMVAAIAEALQFNFYSVVPARQQVLDYLREKRVLLILDNFEHLTDDTSFVTDMLASAPGLKVLVTSRQSLNLREEWRFTVEGMSLSADTSAEDADAMQLFVHFARRAREDVTVGPDDPAVRRICTLVEGMPLAIELAAEWLKSLSPEQIAREIERSSDMLRTRLQNLPERHRSMRAVFEQSWLRLSASEQDTFMRLSALRGFRHDAAEQVGGASLLTLAALIDKSLLRVSSDGRYSMHEFLRQLAEEKLRADPVAHARTLADYSIYYLSFVAQREHRLVGAEQISTLIDTLDEISAESDNIRAAWGHALRRGELGQVASAVNGLYEFYETRCRYAEGEEAFALAVQEVQRAGATDTPLYATALARHGALAESASHYAAAEKSLTESLAIARALGLPSESAFALNGLGHVAAGKGQIKLAIQYFTQSLDISRRIGDEVSAAQTLNQLGWAHGYGIGDAESDIVYQQQSLALCRKHNLQRRMAYVLEDLGTSHLKRGKYAEAERYYEEGLHLFRQLGDSYGIAKASNGLGGALFDSDHQQWQIALQHKRDSIALLRAIGHRRQLATHLVTLTLDLITLERYEEANLAIREALAISSELGDTLQMAFAHINLGRIASGKKDFVQARWHMRQGLQLVSDAGADAYTQWAIVLWQQISIRENLERDADRRAHRLAVLYFVMSQYLDVATATDAKPLIAQLESELSAEVVIAAKERITDMHLANIVAEILQSDG